MQRLSPSDGSAAVLLWKRKAARATSASEANVMKPNEVLSLN